MTDPSGAAVPGARVTLRNPDTGLVRNTTTDSTGSYEFLAVQVGEHYVVEVEASGFRKTSQTGIKLLVNQRYRADFSLVLGATTQSVEVSANPAQVEATSTQLGDVIEDRKMTALPLNPEQPGPRERGAPARPASESRRAALRRTDARIR